MEQLIVLIPFSTTCASICHSYNIAEGFSAMAHSTFHPIPINSVASFAITRRTRNCLVNVVRFKPSPTRAMTALTPLRKQVLLNAFHRNISSCCGIAAAIVDFRTACHRKNHNYCQRQPQQVFTEIFHSHIILYRYVSIILSTVSQPRQSGNPSQSRGRWPRSRQARTQARQTPPRDGYRRRNTRKSPHRPSPC